MKRILQSFTILELLLSSITFVGCDSKDGDVDPIEITVNGQKCKTSTYDVPTSGGEYKLFSKRYGSMWLNAVKENGEVVWPENHDWSNYKEIHLTSDWYEVQYDESGNIVVNISYKETDGYPRKLTFDVECGDAFGNITLQQR